jgi:hypothetical protein
MSFDLYSRVQRIGGYGNCGYRDIVIHEMTESEIENLKLGRWAIPVVTFVLGFIAGAIYLAVALPH